MRAFGWDRSADHIRASGHCGCIGERQSFKRKQAGYMAAPERFAETSDSSCTAGAVHTWPVSTVRGGAVRRPEFEARADIARTSQVRSSRTQCGQIKALSTLEFERLGWGR